MTNLGTVLADAYTVGKILYSKQFEDVDIASKADEIYAFLLGMPVYQQIGKNFGLLGEVPTYLK
jgi:iron complex transport system substrate-binding protein